MIRNKIKTLILVTYGISTSYLRQIQSVSSHITVDWAVETGVILDKISYADVVLAGLFNPEIFKSAKQLKWVQATSAGVERFLFPVFVKSPVLLTCARTVYDIPVAEHSLGLMLVLSRNFHQCVRDQSISYWGRPPGSELKGKILGIIGFGSIGAYLARITKPLGMTIIGWKRNPSTKIYPADEIWTGRKLDKLFSIADYIVIILPNTPETDHLITRKLLSKMKPTAYLINIGRGNVIDEKALVDRLRKKKIAGAGLDVFDREPLPQTSPLWKLPNLIITPHTGGYSPVSDQRMIDLFCRNLNRYLKNKPLLHLVDKKTGY